MRATTASTSSTSAAMPVTVARSGATDGCPTLKPSGGGLAASTRTGTSRRISSCSVSTAVSGCTARTRTSSTSDSARTGRLYCPAARPCASIVAEKSSGDTASSALRVPTTVSETGSASPATAKFEGRLIMLTGRLNPSGCSNS